MKNVIKRILFILLSLWHCSVSFITPYWLMVTFLCFNKHSHVFHIGVFLLLLWLAFFLPSFILLTVLYKRIKSKKTSALIPSYLFVTSSLIGLSAIGYYNLATILTVVFVVMCFVLSIVFRILKKSNKEFLKRYFK